MKSPVIPVLASLWLAFSAAVFSSCSHSRTTSDAGIEIPFDRFKEVSAGSPAEVYQVEAERYSIPLEVEVQAALGDMTKAVMRNGKLYLVGENRNTLVVLPMDGGDCAILAHHGRGPGEYLSITDFDVDNDENIWIVDGVKDLLLQYSAQLEFVGDRSCEFDANKIKCLPNGGFAFQVASWDRSAYSGSQLVFTDAAGTVLTTALQYPDNKDRNIEFYSSMSASGNGFFYNEPIDDHVYQMSENGTVQTVWHFDFGSATVPETWKSDIESHYDKIRNECRFVMNAFGVNGADGRFITCGIRHRSVSPAVFDRERSTVAYFRNHQLLGCNEAGTIWLDCETSEILFYPLLRQRKADRSQADLPAR